MMVFRGLRRTERQHGNQHTNRGRRRIGQWDQHIKQTVSFVANSLRRISLLIIDLRPGNAKHAICPCAKCLALILQVLGLIRVYAYISNQPITFWDAVGCILLFEHSQQSYKLIFTREEAIERRIISKQIFVKNYLRSLLTSSIAYGTFISVWHLSARSKSDIKKIIKIDEK
jgi:hypothetical protein